ncbi:RNase A-like domain-containing protein [Methylobacterium oxalidis]|uniref:RNase A-like domain-containing protein n=1 Tax=Methylobacterium oxalidis TaxID=944322 RepID=UPI0014798111
MHSFWLTTQSTPRKSVGSFDSIEAAISYISDTLKNHIDEVDRVAAGAQKDAFLQTWFGYSTGREAVSISMGTPIRIRTTYGVAIFMVHDPDAERGFRIITAYPENADED